VIDVAMDSYWRDGPGSVSLNEICRRASASKPGVYREFGGEDGLMSATLDHYAELVLAPMVTAIDPAQPLAVTLSSVADALTNPNRPGPAGCLLAKLHHSPTQLGPETAARVAGLRTAARAQYGSLVDDAKQRGEVAAEIPTEVAAAFIDIQCTTLLMGMSFGDNRALLRAQAKLAFAGLTRAVSAYRTS